MAAGIEHDKTIPIASVVVPILNEARTIDETIESIAGQSYSNIEILAVDGGSDDGTAEKLRAWIDRDQRVRVLANPAKSIPAALNVGLRNARGSYFVRVDAHSTIPEDYVERMVHHLESGGVDGVGAKKVAVGSPPSGSAIAAVLSSPFGVGGSAYHYATSVQETDHVPFGAYRVECARSLGGWDERLVANEDYEFDVRVRAAGGKLLLDPTIEVAWKSRSRIGEFAAQYRRYGRGKADVAVLHPSEIRIRHAAPPVAVAGLLVGLAIAPWIPWLTGLAIVGYALVVSLMALPIARRLEAWKDRLKVPIVLAVMQLSWGLGVWQGLFRIVRHGFRLPPPTGDASRWGSPEWTVKDEPPVR